MGREHESELLRGALQRARQEESTQLVTLVGVPGIGKSRLVSELFAALDREPEIMYWRQGRCLPVRRGCDVLGAGRDDQGARGHPRDRQRGAGRREALRGRRGSARRTRTAVGRRPPPAARRPGRRGAPAATRRTRRLPPGDDSSKRSPSSDPLILVFEDLHWADESLLDFVDDLVDWATECRCSSSCTARPELLTRRPGWGGGKPNAATISLSPLSDDETARLVRALLERAVLARRASDHADRARGRQPALCGGVRADGRRGRRRTRDSLPSPCRESSPPASMRSRSRRSSCSRTRPWSARCSGSAR